MEQNLIKLRFAILKTIYKNVGGSPDVYCKLYPSQIEGMVNLDMGYELRFLKERNLLSYTGNFITHRYNVALTEQGASLISSYFTLTSLSSAQREEGIDQLINALK